MTIRIAILVFLVSFAAITGWLVMRQPADSGVAHASPVPRTDKLGTEQGNDNEKPQEVVAVSDAERGLEQTLRSIIIPELDIEDVTLEDTISFLNFKLREIESSNLSDLGFIIRGKAPPELHGGEIPNPGTLKVTLKANDISVAAAIDLLCKQIGYRWQITDDSIEMTPLP